MEEYAHSLGEINLINLHFYRILSITLLLGLMACAGAAVTAVPSTPTPGVPVPQYGKEVVSKLSFKEPRGMTMGYGSLWVDIYSDTLFRVAPASGQTQVTITVGIGGEPAQMAVAGDALWVINAQSASVARVDPKTNQVTDRFKFADICCSLAVFEGGVE